MSNNAHELSNRLLNALDNNYNVVDMHTVNEIISVLERLNITKELLETTRLGKHVNELRRKTTDPTLARRAKVLVKRWRDLVIPTVASPGHTGSNRSSAERQVRHRLGGTPLTSPALSRVASPAVPSPRPPSRPAWGGYESDSQDVILVDDDPPPPAAPAPLAPLAPLANAAHKPLTPPVKRPPSPESLHDEKKAKRDKKPKKKRGHSRAGSGTEATAHLVPPAPVVPPQGAPGPPGPPGPPNAWTARNGSSHERRRNGCRRDAVDPYAALVNRMPPVGAKKVKTTKELLEQIQSRGTKPATSPGSPGSPASPDVMLIEPDFPAKAESPLRNGGVAPVAATPPSPRGSPPRPPSPLEEERAPRLCSCGEEAQAGCPAAPRPPPQPLHVHALHHALLPGVNGTRAPPQPHRFALRKLEDPERPGLFASVVPLYKYSDYADDYCAKNLSRVPLCAHLPWTEFAPPPPEPPPPPSPPPARPYPIDPDPPADVKSEAATDDEADEPEVKPEPVEVETKANEIVADEPEIKVEPAEVEAEPKLEPSDRLRAPTPPVEVEAEAEAEGSPEPMEVEEKFPAELQEHRTVERTKGATDGRELLASCREALSRAPWDYAQLSAAPVLTLPEAEAEAEGALLEALAQAESSTTRDSLGRPTRPERFAEWHECVQLGPLLALPYVVID